MLSRGGPAEVHRFDNRDPQIQQPEARYHPADRSIHEKRGQTGEVVEQLIVRPQRRIPGQHEHDNAYIDADDDIKVEFDAAKPKRNPGRTLGRSLPFLHGRAAWRTGRKEVRLLRHFSQAKARRGSTPRWSIATVTQQPRPNSWLEPPDVDVPQVPPLRFAPAGMTGEERDAFLEGASMHRPFPGPPLSPFVIPTGA